MQRGEYVGALLLPDASPDNAELGMLARSVQQQLANYFSSTGQNDDNSEAVALIQQQVPDLESKYVQTPD